MYDYKDVLAFIVIGILATWARLLVALEKLTIYSVIRTSVTGALVGLIVGLGLVEGSDLEPWIKYSLFGVSIALAEDVFMGILNVGKRFREDPAKFLQDFWKK